MKRQRTVTGFFTLLQSWFGTSFFIIFELYMAVHAIEWQISQHLEQPDRTNWDQVIGHFLKCLRDFRACFLEVYIQGMFWSNTFVVG